MPTVVDTRAWVELMRRSDSDPATGYDLRGEPALFRSDSGHPTMNAGYWRGLDAAAPDALQRASTALLHLVARTAGAGPADSHVLDVGCGTGTLAGLLVERYDVKQVTGLDVAKRPLARARELVQERGLTGRVSIREGSATALPFGGDSLSKVVSVESAYHFAPRTRFFDEAYRVLQPGGTLTLADYVITPPRGPLRAAQLAVLRRALQIPAANVHDLAGYATGLERAGFEVLCIESIACDVLPPYFRGLARKPLHALRDLNPAFIAATATFFLYPWDYVLVTARKA